MRGSYPVSANLCNQVNEPSKDKPLSLLISPDFAPTNATQPKLSNHRPQPYQLDCKHLTMQLDYHWTIVYGE